MVLCTSANCMPSPTDVSSAYCRCDVETGLSMRFTDVYEQGLISNFSFAQFPLQEINCENANYIDCLGAPCTAIGDNKAICECQLTPNAGQSTFVGCSESTDCSMYPFRSGVQLTTSSLNLSNALIQAMGHHPPECTP